MRSRIPARRAVAAALLAVSLLTPPAATRPPRPEPPAPHRSADDGPSRELDRALATRLDKAIEKVRRQAGIPGVVAGLWMPGKGSYVRATGVADKATGEPMNTDVFVRIGSETKTFTATGLLELVDDGRIGLDGPISRYVRHVPDGHRITLRHLAEMRSGLFPYTEDAEFQHDLLSDPQRSFTPEQVLAYGFKHENTFAPGAGGGVRLALVVGAARSYTWHVIAGQ
ncbi:CubicO group peptidase (beta-lactamase class C family) [Streptomyces sp. SAI-133]|nr:CubicO group peptidase (beta-lactamase class C family) [Streptomyces sp. SAI-041]MDH6589501.1 CubicO group peptidase (beta-lactamase class C family) [Streptomyces sp. SAI-133]